MPNQPSLELAFRGWKRSSIYNLVDLAQQPQNGRLLGNLSFQMREVRADGATRQQSSEIPFEIVGPKDVQGINHDAIASMFPKPNTSDNETTFCPYVTFASVDFPWRYTPLLPRDANDGVQQDGIKLQPWLTLLVGTETTDRQPSGEVEILPNQLVKLQSSLLADYPLTQSSAWAHLQVNGDRETSRLMSTRILPPHASLIAVLVPAFDDAARPAWSAGQQQEAVLPLLHHWRFSTGAAGDFVTLAAKLKPGIASRDMGKARLHYALGGVERTFEVRGAMAPVSSRDAAVSQRVQDEFRSLTSLPRHDDRNRPITSMPIYGEAWIERHQHQLWRNLPIQQQTEAQLWQRQANLDPRHRVVAGLGAWCAVSFQEQVVEEIDHQAGDLYIAASRVRKLSSGLNAASALWRKRLPDTPEERLMLFGPALGRLMGADGSALEKLTESERPLAAALFSSAARRAIRCGTARSNHVKPGANNPGSIYRAANDCPGSREVPGGAVTIAEVVKKETDKDYREILKGNLEDDPSKGPDFDSITTLFDKWLPQLLKQWLSVREYLEAGASRGKPLPLALLGELVDTLNLLPKAKDDERKQLEKKIIQLLEALAKWDFEDATDPGDALSDLIRFFLQPPEKRPCKPIDTDQADHFISAAFDPHHPECLMVKRVLDTITGYDPQQPLAPLEIGIDFDFTPWKFLRDLAPNWLLPGLGEVKSDQVFAMQTNPAFIDAFLLGFNKQILSEARWRNIPIQTGTTPCRIFWGRPNPQELGKHLRDIQPVEAWGPDTPIGHESHKTPEAEGTDLILFLRSDLFKRYPDTVISLRRAPMVPLDENDPDGDRVPDWEAEPLTEPLENNQRLPVFMGVLSEDIYFFGFDIDPAEARNWWVCLEEPVSAPRFRNASGFPAGIENDDQEDEAQQYADALTAGDSARTAANAVRASSVVLIRGSSIIPRH